MKDGHQSECKECVAKAGKKSRARLNEKKRAEREKAAQAELASGVKVCRKCGRKLPIYGDGKNIRDWLYVEDHAKGIDMVQEKGRLFETYNIGGHNERQNIQIVKTIIKTLQELLPDDDPRKANVSEDLITYVTDRKGHDRRYAIAPDKIKAEVGWYPETCFEDGIKKTVKWYLEHQEWMDHCISGDYQKYYDDMYKNR